MIFSRSEIDQRRVEIYSEFDCKHATRSLRARKVAGGSIQRVWQCSACGWPVSNALSKAEAIKIAGTSELPAFDDELQAKWGAQRVAALDKAEVEYREKIRGEYGDYLGGEPWKRKRLAVFKRCNYLCEGCAENKATEVHHLTYAHLGNEFLFELVGLCEGCHKRVHEDDIAQQEQAATASPSPPAPQ
jgi:ribosomal protein L37AE/L43A